MINEHDINDWEWFWVEKNRKSKRRSTCINTFW